MIPRSKNYFAGGGLLDLGLAMAGIRIIQSFELDRICCETLRRNFTHEVVEGDLTRSLAADEAEAEVMVATYPCDRYSAIADIHGCRTGDELYLHFLRRIALRPPEVYVLENVPGMKKFPVVMEAMTQLPDYFVQMFCPVSSQWWLPQQRDRLIIFGSRRCFTWRLPSPRRRVRLRDIVERDARPRCPDYVRRRLKGSYRDKPIISDPAGDDIAPTCVAHYAKDLSTRLVVDRRASLGVRPYTVREYARLQGVPDWFEFAGGESAAYRMIGNGVSVPVGEWIGRELLRYFN